VRGASRSALFVGCRKDLGTLDVRSVQADGDHPHIGRVALKLRGCCIGQHACNLTLVYMAAIGGGIFLSSMSGTKDKDALYDDAD
jgi:hypothetical protein